ncbi:MBL fold metallo-hydrolase [uncultured Ferrimonas sp.]|uniref:MBL fold metallo-hydrolase n=1 Tax=uncultured Ferrimonas sp. TaxID=432640 RepID=UPI0026110A17|nr:MBL fold metallo-hydrolase [uncultured Ferrimonas sp.]
MKIFLLVCLSLLLLSCKKIDVDLRTNSAHFNEGKFNNSAPINTLTFWEIARAGFNNDTKRAVWPEWVNTDEVTQELSTVTGDKIRISFINHATFLIQTNGVNILTDPVFSDRASPVTFIGPKRAHKPAIALANLPKIDVIIISHDHYDHLDLDSVHALVARDNPKIYVGLGVGNHLSNAANVRELDWGDSVQVTGNVTLWFLEVQHNSGRSLTDRNATLWGGYLLQLGNKQIYFGGDSGYGDHYKRTFEQFGAVDVALLPIGAYAPRKLFQLVHLDPYQAVQAHQDLQAKLSIGMHYGTFQLTSEPRLEPLELLQHAKQSANLAPNEFITLELGQPLELESQTECQLTGAIR